MTRLLIWLAAVVSLSSAGCDLEQTPYNAMDLVRPSHGTSAFFNRFDIISVSPDDAYDQQALEALALTLVQNAEESLDVALDNFESEPLAQALIAVHQRGVRVRVVGDEDRREQLGFVQVEMAGLDVAYGDGAIPWQAVFGADSVQRTGADNLMLHNFILADRIRLLNVTNGFPAAANVQPQAGFVAASEDLGKDYGDCFDQLFGGVFSTNLTFYDDTVSSDTNNRTSYPSLHSIMEVQFGPQEPLVKDMVDQIYAAKSSVRIASPVFRNDEIARALRYKASVGFEVKMVVANFQDPSGTAQNLAQWFTEIQPPPGGVAPEIRVSSAVSQTLILIDGRSTRPGGAGPPGRILVTPMPIFEATGFRADRDGPGGELVYVAQPAGLFSDVSMWMVHESSDPAALGFKRLTAAFERLFAGGAAP